MEYTKTETKKIIKVLENKNKELRKCIREREFYIKNLEEIILQGGQNE